MGWPWLDSRRSPRLFYSSPLYSSTQGRKYTKDSWAEVRTGRHHSLLTITGKRVDLGTNEFKLLPITSGKDNEEQKQILKHFPPTLPFLLGSTLLSVFLPAPSHGHRGAGNRGCSQFPSPSHPCCSFLPRARTPHTLPLLYCGTQSYMNSSCLGPSNMRASIVWITIKPHQCSFRAWKSFWKWYSRRSTS